MEMYIGKALIILGLGFTLGYLLILIGFIISEFIPGESPDTAFKSLLRKQYALLAWIISRIFKR